MIITIGIGKAFDKIQHSCMILKKPSQQNGNIDSTSPHNKVHILTNPHATSYSIMKG